MTFARKIYKIPEFDIIFARRIPEFYVIIVRKIFSPNFRGARAPTLPVPPPPTPMLIMVTVCNVIASCRLPTDNCVSRGGSIML